MATLKQERELFIRRVAKLIALALDAVSSDLGHIETGEVARRVARNLWMQTDLKGHRTVAAWVKHVRLSTGKTQAQFAHALGTTQVTVARWETGKSVPSRPYWKAISTIGRGHWIWDEEVEDE